MRSFRIRRICWFQGPIVGARVMSGIGVLPRVRLLGPRRDRSTPGLLTGTCTSVGARTESPRSPTPGHRARLDLRMPVVGLARARAGLARHREPAREIAAVRVDGRVARRAERRPWHRARRRLGIVALPDGVLADDAAERARALAAADPVVALLALCRAARASLHVGEGVGAVGAVR